MVAAPGSTGGRVTAGIGQTVAAGHRPLPAAPYRGPVAIEPPPSAWIFPPAEQADEHGVVGVGADLEPGTLLAAYRVGLFPMPVGRRRLAWWSPDPRGVLPIDGLRVSPLAAQGVPALRDPGRHRLRGGGRRLRRPPRPHGWITRDIRRAYGTLHELGWAHSVEAWSDGELVGGLYGVGDRRPLRRRVDVPPGDRRLQGGPRRAWSTCSTPTPTRCSTSVGDAAPRLAGRGRDPPTGVPRPPRPRPCDARAAAFGLRLHDALGWQRPRVAVPAPSPHNERMPDDGRDRGAGAGRALADADLLGALDGPGLQRAVPHEPGQGPDRPVDRLRPAHPDRLRPRPPPGPGRGRQGRRARRPPRPHAHAARRDPRRRDEHLDDDQRHRGVAARPLRGQRRGAGRRQRRAAGHDPERHRQGVPVAGAPTSSRPSRPAGSSST